MVLPLPEDFKNRFNHLYCSQQIVWLRAPGLSDRLSDLWMFLLPLLWLTDL